MKQTIKQFFKKYTYIILPCVYGLWYLCAFFYVESLKPSSYHIVHLAIDDIIPFCEIFVIPYFLWFVYFTGALVLLAFFERSDYYKLCATLGIGMTFFIFFSIAYPNMHTLRPTTFDRDNIFIKMVQGLYQTDTSTNVLPSIHCYNAIMAHIAIQKSKTLEKHAGLRISSLILCVLIVLSTMLIKQHSVVDVLSACVMAVVLYVGVYIFFPRVHKNK